MSHDNDGRVPVLALDLPTGAYVDPGRLLEARFLETMQLQWLAANEAILRCDIPSRMIARIRERVRLQREAFEKHKQNNKTLKVRQLKRRRRLKEYRGC